LDSNDLSLKVAWMASEFRPTKTGFGNSHRVVPQTVDLVTVVLETGGQQVTIGTRLLGVVDYEHIYRASRRLQFQPELLLQRGEDRMRM
jgi:hypothetical protein